MTSGPLKDGFTMGIDWNYFNDCDPVMLECCKASVDHVVAKYGVKVVDISIPELNPSMRAHIITILR